MPIARIQMPNGWIGRFDVPDGMTPDQVMQFVQQSMAEQAGPPAPPLAGNGPQMNYTDPGYQEAIAGQPTAPSSIQTQPKPRPWTNSVTDYLSGITDAATQGQALGFGDELRAVASTAVDVPFNLVRGQPADIGGTYDKNLADIRAQQEAFSKANPTASLAAEITGGLASAAPIAGKMWQAANAAPAVVRAMRPVVAGAVPGAIAGAGYSDGDMGDRAGGAAGGAALGGMTGGALALALPPALKVGGAAYRAVVDRFGKGPKTAAERKMVQALERDGMTPGMLSARLKTLGPEATIADSGGRNVVGLAETSANAPGQAQQMATRLLEGRQKGAGPRIGTAASRELGDAKYYSTLGELNDARRVAASPLYDEAFGSGAQVWSPKIERFVNDPIAKEAMGRGLKIQRLEAVADGKPYDPTVYGIAPGDPSWEQRVIQSPNLRALDAVKRGLDDILEGFRDKVTGKLVLDETGRAIDQFRRSYVSALDEVAPPAYKAARQAWSGPSQLMDAIHLGRNFMRPDSEITDRMVSGMAKGEKEAFLVGVRQGIQDIVDRTRDTANAVNKIIGTPRNRAALQAAFPDQGSYRRFVADLLRESKFNQTRNTVLSNSATARRLAGQEDLNIDPNPMVNVLSGNYIGAARGMLSGLLKRATDIPEAQKGKLSAMLLSKDPAKNAAAIGALSDRVTAKTLSRAQRQGLASALMSETGLMEGKASAR